jgi:DNA-binding transcriptional MocR family regulator
MSIKNYSGGEISDEGKEDLENKWKQHIMSPLEKEKLGLRSVPLGFGSKNPDYLGHRAWDRAIGRAE